MTIAFPPTLRIVDMLVDGVRPDTIPAEVSYRKKLNAGTTFKFQYPNQDGLARGLFREFNSEVEIFFFGAKVLSGVVSMVSNGPISTVEVVDAVYQTSLEDATVDEVNLLGGFECGKAIETIMKGLEGGFSGITSEVIGTNPQVFLPRDFIDALTKKNTLIRKIHEFVENETAREGLAPVKYVFGVIDGAVRFQRIPDTDPILILDRLQNTLFEMEPTIHFDRLVNSAQVTGTDAEGNDVIGPLYEDKHSINIRGRKVPPTPLKLDTDVRMELLDHAIKEVEQKKQVFATRVVDVPHGHFLTPGFHSVQIENSIYGFNGRAQVVQVEGAVGSGGRTKVTLDTVTIDEIEVMLTIIDTR